MSKLRLMAGRGQSNGELNTNEVDIELDRYNARGLAQALTAAACAASLAPSGGVQRAQLGTRQANQNGSRRRFRRSPTVSRTSERKLLKVGVEIKRHAGALR